MPVTQPPAEGPRTESAFEECLVWLLRTARENGVPIEGGWVNRNRSTHQPDWGIEIYQVTKPAAPTD